MCEAHPCARDYKERKRAWPLKDQLCPNEGQQVAFTVGRIKNKTNKKPNDYNNNNKNGLRPFLGARCGTDFCSSLPSERMALKGHLGGVSFQLHLLGVKNPGAPSPGVQTVRPLLLQRTSQSTW